MFSAEDLPRPSRIGNAFFIALFLSLALHGAILAVLPRQHRPPIKAVPCQLVLIAQGHDRWGAPPPAAGGNRQTPASPPAPNPAPPPAKTLLPKPVFRAAASIPKNRPTPPTAALASPKERPSPPRAKEAKQPPPPVAPPDIPAESSAAAIAPALAPSTKAAVAPKPVGNGAGDTKPANADSVSGSGEAAPTHAPLMARFGEGGGPRVIEMPTPRYPMRARRRHLEGQVLLMLELDRAGMLRQVNVVEPAGNGFDEAALLAVKNARFQPASDRGVQVACRALLPISFRLRP